MRFANWSAVLFTLFIAGCGEQAIHSAATERPEPRQAVDNDAEKATPLTPALDGTADHNSPAAAGGIVELEAIALTAPSRWQRKQASSSFVAAEFSLPRAEGDDADGRLTVSSAGGTVEANIDRWKGQFQPQPKVAKQEVVDVAGLKVTFVDYSGDFNDQRGPFAPGQTRPGYRMIAAVIPIDGQLHFVKATGPERTMALHADDIHQFVRSTQLNK
jgi:hypothetical protein